MCERSGSLALESRPTIAGCILSSRKGLRDKLINRSFTYSSIRKFLYYAFLFLLSLADALRSRAGLGNKGFSGYRARDVRQRKSHRTEEKAT